MLHEYPLTPTEGEKEEKYEWEYVVKSEEESTEQWNPTLELQQPP